MRYLKPFFVVLLSAGTVAVHAQKKPAVKANVISKKNLPKLTTVLGTYKDSVAVSIDAAQYLVEQTLLVSDDKNNPYEISSYQVVYRKLGVTEDEQTGKVTPTTSVSTQLLRTTPLPPVWQNTLREQMKKGEQLWFIEVIVKDKAGHVWYAPNVKISFL
ncbi:MAG: hypothetical protein JWQ27_837 [Ferruginibacter sp.]|nr:hypothetical protein [Ferruginibacter sp.]